MPTPLHYTLERSQLLSRPLDEVFAFFSRAENLQAITPAWLDFRIVGQLPLDLRAGTRIQYRFRWRVVAFRWTTEITLWEPPFRFVDDQISGPYRLWRHEHRFEARNGHTLMHDRVDYALPFGILGRGAHAALVRRDVNAIFDYRARTVAVMFSGTNLKSTEEVK